jgi:hypothetical protein
MCHALHLGIKKALGVVASHYQVDFGAVSSGYFVPISVKDEEAMNRADALAATAGDMLAEDFADFLFPDARCRRPSSLKTTGRRALFCLSVSVEAMWPCNGRIFA